MGGWTVADGLAEQGKRYRAGRVSSTAPSTSARTTGAARAAGVATAAPSSPAGAGSHSAGAPISAAPRPRKRVEKLSKDAYRKQKAALDAELTRLGLRKNHLELAIGDPAVAANFVEMRRVTSELADVNSALATAEDAWLQLEERAP